MKNLKKVLAFVMVFTMVLSVAVSAGVLYPDVEDNASYAEAVATLKALDIMEGDDKGNFNPEASIIRAETAAVVARMRALSKAAAGKTNFTDVAADHWASGYINLAEQTGIINGYGDGNFGPSDPVTYEQVIKMIVAALGYGPKAEGEGGYPSGYMTIASQKDILKGVSVAPGEAAPRSAVARLIFNALEVPTMEQDGYKPGEPSYKETTKTLLYDYLKVDKYEGVVSDTYATKVSDADDDEIKIALTSVNGNTEGIDASASLAEGDTDATGFLGMAVSAFAKEDEVTGKPTLLGIAAKTNKNEVLTISYDEIVAGSWNDATGSGESLVLANFKYSKDNGDDLKVEVDVAGHEFKNSGASVNSLKTFVTGSNTNGVLTLIDNDADDVYEYSFVTQYAGSDNYVIGEINASAKTLKDKKGNAIRLYLNNEAYRTVFYLDGAQIAFEDLKVDDLLTVAKNGKLYTAYVSRNVIEGSVGSVSVESDPYYTIGAARYHKDATADIENGATGKFYVNFAGRIAYAEATAAAGNYGFLYNAYLGAEGFTKAATLEFLAIDGTWQTVALAETVDFYVNGVEQADDDAADGLEKDDDSLFFGGDYNALTGQFETITQCAFEYQTKKDGTINKIWIATEANDEFSLDASESGAEFRKDMNKLGDIWFTDETPVFSVPAGTGYIADTDVTEICKKEEIVITKAGSLFADLTDYTVDAFDVENTYPAVAVAYGAEAAIHNGTSVLIVTSIASVRSEEGQTLTKIYGYQNGEEVEALIAEDGADILDADDSDSGSDYTPTEGDIIIFSLDADNAINKVKVLMTEAIADGIIDEDLSEGGAVINATETGEDSYIYFAHANALKNGNITLGNGYEVEGDAYVTSVLTDGGKSVAMRIAGVNANFYEVNAKRAAFTCTNEFDESMISTVVEETNDTHWVFVREYDGVVTDVVAYRVEVSAIEAIEA